MRNSKSSCSCCRSSTALKSTRSGSYAPCALPEYSWFRLSPCETVRGDQTVCITAKTTGRPHLAWLATDRISLYRTTSVPAATFVCPIVSQVLH
ncbi:hypothetical protein PoB_007371600 [Plakobranchus ocellatus]|uniref:Ig-like domain-containing protein n=1 Tax=Plakobranchus ocellatus TaxID=259542 RepID=A0AAV4DT08_9GAST|nr:hypothetical protein PoB_007371600 [Plakobranchus ocellatus]